MIKEHQPYNILLRAAILLLVCSFFIGAVGFSFEPLSGSDFVSFAFLWRLAAAFLFFLWIVYRLLDERLLSERLVLYHVLASLLLVVMVIGYPLWMNMVAQQHALYLVSGFFVAAQIILVVNIVLLLRSTWINRSHKSSNLIKNT